MDMGGAFVYIVADCGVRLGLGCNVWLRFFQREKHVWELDVDRIGIDREAEKDCKESEGAHVEFDLVSLAL